jgi:hypothetical protein
MKQGRLFDINIGSPINVCVIMRKYSKISQYGHISVSYTETKE